MPVGKSPPQRTTAFAVLTRDAIIDITPLFLTSNTSPPCHVFSATNEKSRRPNSRSRVYSYCNSIVNYWVFTPHTRYTNICHKTLFRLSSQALMIKSNYKSISTTGKIVLRQVEHLSKYIIFDYICK